MDLRKHFLNPGMVDGILQSVDSRKQLLNPVVVDGNAKTVSKPCSG